MLKELEAAINAALIGGRVLNHFRSEGVTIRSKEGGLSYDLVSDADVGSEQAITAYLSNQFPTHEILGEEEAKGDVSAEHLWVVDPLDGTNNFAHDVPHFAVSIGYYQAGKPHTAVVYNPVRGDCYYADVGLAQAYHCVINPEDTPLLDKLIATNTEQVNALRVATSESLADCLVGVGFYYDRGAMMQATLKAIEVLFGQQIHGIRRFGTASLDLCQVAAGMFGAFFEYQLSPWDFAAGRFIVERAGGKISTCRGASLPMERTSVLATNTLLHPAMLNITTKYHP